MDLSECGKTGGLFTAREIKMLSTLKLMIHHKNQLLVFLCSC